MEVPMAVYVIWAVWLVIAYLSVPLLVSVLTRILRASRKIEGYAGGTRTASSGIRAHLESAGALARTESLLGQAKGIGEELASQTERLTGELLRRAGGES